MDTCQDIVGERTGEYIASYLDPFMWTMTPEWDEITDTTGVDESEVAHVILQMKYSEFLETPYWSSISREVKRRAGEQCQKCGSESDLVVHHTRYNHHGWEHLHMDDLCCLCRRCHEAEHNNN